MEQITTIATMTTPVLLVVLLVQQRLARIENARRLEQVHVLVNSKMGDQLRISASLSKRLAALTGLPDDLLAAMEHEAMAHNHETKQARVDVDSG